jgi:hypothetical protein
MGADEPPRAVVHHVRAEHDHRALDLVDAAPLLHLSGMHQEDVTGQQLVLGEVDGVLRRTALDPDEQVEVQALWREELGRPTAVADALERVHLDGADVRRGWSEANLANGRVSRFHHQCSRQHREPRPSRSYRYQHD